MSELHSSVLLCFSTTLCTAQQNLSIGVGVVRERIAFIYLSPFTILDGATENRVIARALAPVAIRSPCRQRRRGALHRKKTDSHDQFANWSRNDRGGCEHPPDNISDGTMWASSPTILLP